MFHFLKFDGFGNEDSATRFLHIHLKTGNNISV